MVPWLLTWYSAFGGVLCVVGSVVGIFVHFLDLPSASFKDGSVRDWILDWIFWIFWLLVCVGFAALGVWMAWPLVLALTDLFGLTNTAGIAVRAREAAYSVEGKDTANGLSWAMRAAAIFIALVAPFLTFSMLRENPRSIRAWLVLLAIPIGGMVALAFLGTTLAVTLPNNIVVDWFARSFTQPTGTLTFALWVETSWFAMILIDHSGGFFYGPVTIALTPFAGVPMLMGFYLDVHFAIRMLLFGASAFLAWIIRAFVHEWEKYSEQLKRNQRAEQIQNAVLGASGHSTYPKFSLYLRSFRSTNTLDTQGAINEAPVPEPLDIETVLAKAVMPHSQLLALSTPREAGIVGAERLFLPDENWWPSFQKLASRAVNIFVLASYRLGTLGEVRWLIEQDYLENCVFIMPETPFREGLAEIEESHREVDHAAEWQMAADAVKMEAGITLPPYDRRGAMFTLRADGSVSVIVPLNLSSTLFRVARVRKAVRAVSTS
jgi:hypothetical protein